MVSLNPDTKMAQRIKRVCSHYSAKNSKNSDAENRPNSQVTKPKVVTGRPAPYSEVVTMQNKIVQVGDTCKVSAVGCGALVAGTLFMVFMLSKIRQRT